MKGYKFFLLIIGIFISGNILANPLPQQINASLPDFSVIYENAGKAVVNISVTQELKTRQGPIISGDPAFDFFFRRMFPEQQQRQQRALGSGFIISSDGYILTNAHVVDNADTINVKLSDKREFKAKVVGIDKDSDVAIIKITAKNLPYSKIGNPNILKPGNWVVSIGSPFGFENTITKGIVSALSRNLPDDSTVPFIQTDVPINRGNSGGPLINLNGEVVGVNSQIYSTSGGYMGISFAIPIDYAMRIAEQLKTTGKFVRGRLGVGIQPVNQELAKSFKLKNAHGALINSVDEKSPAEAAGIKVGDIVLKANGQEITDPRILSRVVSNAGPNKVVDLEIWRNGQLINIKATTGLSSAITTANAANPTENKPNVKGKIAKLGLQVDQLTKEQLSRIGGGLLGGLVIQDLGNEAQLAGLVKGDIIIGVGNQPVLNLVQFQQLLSRTRSGEVVALKIVRVLDQYRSVTIFVPMQIK